MKLIAFAALALTAAACTASPDVLDSSVQNAAVTSEAKDASPISIDFDSTAVTNLECDFDGGDPENWSVQFDFEGKHFNATRHIDFWGCQNDRSSMAGVHTGVIVHAADQSVTITLDNGKTTFEAGATDNVTTTSSPLSFVVPADAACHVRQGWFIEFSFDGHAFDTYGADDINGCNGRLSVLKDGGSLPATLTVETHSTFVKRTITTTEGQWTFTSYEQTSS